jgi:hypothetical protein
MDRFSYSISDGGGGTATADVEIFVAAGNLPSRNQVSLTPTPNRSLIRFAGLPGQTYAVQRSTDLNTWTPLAALVAPLHGTLQNEDTNPPPGMAFYRTVVP